MTESGRGAESISGHDCVSATSWLPSIKPWTKERGAKGLAEQHAEARGAGPARGGPGHWV